MVVTAAPLPLPGQCLFNTRAHRHGGDYTPPTEENPSSRIVTQQQRHGGDYTPRQAPGNTVYTPASATASPGRLLDRTPIIQQPPPPVHLPVGAQTQQTYGTGQASYMRPPAQPQYMAPQPQHAYTGEILGPHGGVQPRGGIMEKPNVNISSQSVAVSHSSTTTAPTGASASKYRDVPQKMLSTWHVVTTHTLFRWKRVHHYQAPEYVYDSTQKFRHRDFAGRVTEGPLFDRYLHHYDGRLRKLIVASTDDIFRTHGTSTWRRTYVRKQAGLKVRIATWVIDYSYDPDSWNDWFLQLLRTFPAVIGMTLCFWSHGEPYRLQFYGNYAPAPYKYHGDAKVWSNHLENRKGTYLTARNNQAYRILKPRHLCFLKHPQDDELYGVDVRSVDDWECTDGQGANLSYIFVAYSTEHFSHGSDADKAELHHIAEVAARAAKVTAYWVAVSCMRNEAELESDVFRIADVLRGAHEMIIAVGQPSTALKLGSKLSTGELLKEWGRRMWTFPEVLLSPGKQIRVYTRGGDLRAPMIISKNQFAGRVWSDADDSRQLIDNSTGDLALSRLEQSVIALRCLYRRQTTQYLDGDQAYALMGLLRMRPQIDGTDSSFQAFARLSLANDSDMLLERYLCTLPVSLDQPWYNMEDAYQSSLWDIYPKCQVAAICDNDTVILDGARAASIRWKSFFRISYATNFSWKRWLAIKLMHWNGYTLIIASALLYFANPPHPSVQSSSSRYDFNYTVSAFYVVNYSLLLPGLIFLFIGIYIWFLSPRLIRLAYGGKFVDVQAALFGVEGYISAPTVERAIFGGAFGRMSWSTNGSPLCRSYVNEHGERVGMDPTRDPKVKAKVERSKLAKPGEMRVFTLVDTYNMEVTLFEAVRPPVCLFLCASEGGMQRAIGCSYDWTTQTMYRETVLRMPTTTLNRMSRVSRVRMGIQRPNMPCHPKRSYA